MFVNNQFPIFPPTLNVATFDALKADGRPYNNTINKDLNAAGDSLISQPINLKDSAGVAYTLADSIMFSFFYQPNGYGYHLNGEDSLRLFFKQTYQFGQARPVLNKKYPSTAKLTYWFPSLFVISLKILRISVFKVSK